MSRNKETSALVDNILRLVAGGTVITIGLISPQMIEMLDKPTRKLFDKLDERDKERKIVQTIRYIQKQGYLAGEYEHGLKITKKAQQRLEKLSYDALDIPKPINWDEKWRLVFFDIPEQNRIVRNSFTSKLRLLGYQPLQQSIWIHPFESRDVVAKITEVNKISEFVSYVVAEHIDNGIALRSRFKHLIKQK